MMMMMQKFKSNFEFCGVHTRKKANNYLVSSKKETRAWQFPPRARFFLQEREAASS